MYYIVILALIGGHPSIFAKNAGYETIEACNAEKNQVTMEFASSLAAKSGQRVEQGPVSCLTQEDRDAAFTAFDKKYNGKPGNDT